MNNILLLGGSGFLGSNLLSYIDSFSTNSYNIIVFDKKPSHIVQKKYLCVKKVYSGDFSSKQDIKQIFEENKIDQVFHFLNTTTPSTSADIRFDIESNLLSTIGLLEIMSDYNVHKIVFISSGGAIYGNAQGLYHTENEDAFPLSSYGIVKLAIEKYIHMFSQQSNMNYLILRLSNPYGPFHNSTKQGLINVALKKHIQKEKVEIWGDGTNRKDYIFVEDFIDILMKLIDTNVSNEIINIGSGISYSINEILEKIKLIDSTFFWEYIDNKIFDNMTFSLNLSKLNSFIPNYKVTSLDIGIRKTYDWLKTRERKNHN